MRTFYWSSSKILKHFVHLGYDWFAMVFCIPILWFKEFRISAKHIKHNITKNRMLIFPSSHYIIFVPSRSVVVFFVLRIWGIMCICALVKHLHVQKHFMCSTSGSLMVSLLEVWWEVCFVCWRMSWEACALKWRVWASNYSYTFPLFKNVEKSLEDCGDI